MTIEGVYHKNRGLLALFGDGLRGGRVRAVVDAGLRLRGVGLDEGVGPVEGARDEDGPELVAGDAVALVLVVEEDRVGAVLLGLGDEARVPLDLAVGPVVLVPAADDARVDGEPPGPQRRSRVRRAPRDVPELARARERGRVGVAEVAP